MVITKIASLDNNNKVNHSSHNGSGVTSSHPQATCGSFGSNTVNVSSIPITTTSSSSSSVAAVNHHQTQQYRAATPQIYTASHYQSLPRTRTSAQELASSSESNVQQLQLSEQISALFPKCRPKFATNLIECAATPITTTASSSTAPTIFENTSDINLNSSVESPASSNETMASEMSHISSNMSGRISPAHPPQSLNKHIRNSDTNPFLSLSKSGPTTSTLFSSQSITTASSTISSATPASAGTMSTSLGRSKHLGNNNINNNNNVNIMQSSNGNTGPQYKNNELRKTGGLSGNGHAFYQQQSNPFWASPSEKRRHEEPTVVVTSNSGNIAVPTTSSNILSSPDLTEIDPRITNFYHSGHHYHHHHHQAPHQHHFGHQFQSLSNSKKMMAPPLIKVGRSPVSENVAGGPLLADKQRQLHADDSVNSSHMVDDGEMVVFDDIGGCLDSKDKSCWQKLRITSPEDSSLSSPPSIFIPQSPTSPSIVVSTGNSQSRKTIPAMSPSLGVATPDQTTSLNHTTTPSSGLYYQNYQNLNHNSYQQRQLLDGLLGSSNSSAAVSYALSSSSGATTPASYMTAFKSKTFSSFQQLQQQQDKELSRPGGIIDYDGSPRKFGSNGLFIDGGSEDLSDQSNILLPAITTTAATTQITTPPRPGFPQRVFTSTSTPPYQHNYYTNNLQRQQQQHQQQQPQQPSNKHQSQLQKFPKFSTAQPTLTQSVSLQQIQHHYQVREPEPEAPMPAPLNTAVTSTAATPSRTITDDTSNDVSEIGTTSEITFRDDLLTTAVTTQTPNLTNDTPSATFDYLYEFSETRKVLEEFFRSGPTTIGGAGSIENVISIGDDDDDLDDDEDCCDADDMDECCDDDDDVDADEEEEEDEEDIDQRNHIGENGTGDIDSIVRMFTEFHERRFTPSDQQHQIQQQQQNQHIPLAKENGINTLECHNDIDYFLDSGSRSSVEQLDNDATMKSFSASQINLNPRTHSRCFRYSPTETTDYDSNCGDLDSLSGGEFNGGSLPSQNQQYTKYYASMPVLEDGLSSGHASDTENNNNANHNDSPSKGPITTGGISMLMASPIIQNDTDSCIEQCSPKTSQCGKTTPFKMDDLDALYSINITQLTTPPPPAPAPHRTLNLQLNDSVPDMVQSTLNDIKVSIQRTKLAADTKSSDMGSPVWIPRHLDAITPESPQTPNIQNPTQLLLEPQLNDDDEADTDLETDRLLGHQRLDDQGFYDDINKSWKPRSLLTTSLAKISPKIQPSAKQAASTLLRQGLNALLPTTPEAPMKNSTNKLLDISESGSPSPEHDSSEKSPMGGLNANSNIMDVTVADTTPSKSEGSNKSMLDEKKTKKSKSKEVLIEGVLFRARYLGSTQLVCEGQPTKSTRMMQAEEAVSRIKAPDGDAQPSTDVDLFISTEKIMVLNTDLKEIMMDHALRTISYIADIGDLVVLMARRRFVPNELDDPESGASTSGTSGTAAKPNRTPKMICHVFESDEAQFIAQSIGQAFQVAYMEFLKANGIEDHSFVKEMDYQEVLNSQEIFGDELEIFAKKELQKEVVVPKAKGEILGVVIVESGWGSMLPTVVIANLLSTGAAARCGQLNIGDQIIAINGMSLVGLPLSTCQTYIKNTKNQTVVKFTVVPCAPVVEVKIKRPNTKYQLGFSVQNGVICSLLRGGIAERGGVRVGHRIIEINNQSVVAVPHEKIVNLLATSVGEILMKTMPTSMFRLLTGQENPIYI